MVLVSFSKLPSPIKEPRFTFPTHPNPTSSSIPMTDSSSTSSTSSMSAVATRTKNAVILDIQTLQKTVRDLEDEIGALKRQLAVSDGKFTDLAAEVKTFKIWAGRNELKRRQVEKEQSEREKEVTARRNESGSD